MSEKADLRDETAELKADIIRLATINERAETKVSKTQILMDIYGTACTSIGLPLPLDAPAVRLFRIVIAEPPQ